MEKLIEIRNNEFLQELFGVEDKNIKDIEKEFDLDIFLKNNGVLLKGKREQVIKGEVLLQRMMNLYQQGISVPPQDLSVLSVKGARESIEETLKIKVPSIKKKYIFPRTSGQKEYIKAISEHDVTFAIGPAGTGKTYLAMAMAVHYLMKKEVSRIILVRPAIEAGESLGFLPGDMYQKLSPYLRPLYDALYDMIDPDIIEEYSQAGIIEVAPLAYMRGRTLNNAFIVLDEAQNCTSEQLKMFLTRLGFDSKTIVAGDITQSDLPGGRPAGLLEAVRILEKIPGINFTYLSRKDVVRHLLTQKIIEAYEDHTQEE
ncbi:MAG: PhoH family protein [Candidatus Omnitrophica bacterium]|nr:PhoH family protein [Candidatus Omnitrophota bacterium]